MGMLWDSCIEAAAPGPIQYIRAPCEPVQTVRTWVPADFLEAHEVSAWQNMPAWLPATGENAGFGRRSTARAQAAGLRCRPLQQTIRDTLEYWQSQPDERRAHPKAGLTSEREAAVLAAWHERNAGD